uniref:Uncharacterized protein n=1 Tax=Zea mays TaxID=4577 RepID=A0A804MF11_MAIZE
MVLFLKGHKNHLPAYLRMLVETLVMEATISAQPQTCLKDLVEQLTQALMRHGIISAYLSKQHWDPKV